MFVKYDVDNNIVASCEVYFPGSTEVDFAIERGWDGKLYRTGDAPERPLGDIKAAKLAEINNGCQAALEALTPTYPERELHSFANQEREAREYKAAPDTAQTPLLSALAAARGIGLAELADRVLAKAAAFATASGHIIGQRQHMEDMLDACGSVDAVRAIMVSYSLPGAGSTGGA